MGPPLGCRCRLAACALGSRGILKRESGQSADRCVWMTILPIEHPEWNTRARVHPVRHARLREGPELSQRRSYPQIRRHSTMQGQWQRRDTKGACDGDHAGHARRAPRPGTDRGRQLPRPQPRREPAARLRRPGGRPGSRRRWTDCAAGLCCALVTCLLHPARRSRSPRSSIPSTASATAARSPPAGLWRSSTDARSLRSRRRSRWPMPEAPDPETVAVWQERLKEYGDQVPARWLRPRPVEVRYVGDPPWQAQAIGGPREPRTMCGCEPARPCPTTPCCTCARSPMPVT
jgi:hypothetical protein